MTTCYAQLRLKGLSDFSNFSFTALFISQDTGRKFETNKLKIHSTGISVEAQFPLKKNENAKNCSVRFNVFLPTGRLLEPKPFMGITYTKENGSRVKHTEHEVKLVAHTTSSSQNHNVNQVQIAHTVPAPDGLIMVAYYNYAINESGRKYGVDPQAIGSIVFQEKFFSVAAVGKNVLAYVVFDRFGVKETRSYGLGEMQLGLAADLLDYPKNDKDRLRKAFDLITNNPQIATDLVAKNISLKQKKIGRKLSPREATILHNAGEKFLDSYLSPNSNKAEFDSNKFVYNRSRNWQGSIKEALKGIIYSKPDNCKTCEASPRTLSKYWKPGEGYTGI
ncbi:hypothetical protein [Acinetobacter equi]|uniref:Transglycosylase SLT domain-containing protein n=1 Tax=Acinetobacter equi TaxID=1324350 RepID=A0A0N9W2A6_9GAMM|nr:hypothetical protein [Acinetobacter equi]ALH95679.1 hypothetical protein AOY20_09125 [Acinetobacter equi]